MILVARRPHRAQLASAALDAEDWRNLVSAYLDAASGAVTQMGGRVAKKLGDGLMALFGHPIAQ
jgi:class 3 adenylate cyclase